MIITTKIKDNTIKNLKLSLNSEMKKILSIDENNRNLIIIYENNKLILEKGFCEVEEQQNKSSGELLFFKQNYSIHSKNFIVKIPKIILKNFMLNENEEFRIILYSDKIYLEKIEKNIFQLGKIVSVSLNAGSIGKTYITSQLAIKTAMSGFKTLIISSNTRNDMITHFSDRFSFDFFYNFDNDLKQQAISLRRSNEVLKLRENLYFLPNRERKINYNYSDYLLKLPNFLEELKKEYDFIFIDISRGYIESETFLRETDNLILVSDLSNYSLRGLYHLLLQINCQKITGVIINKVNNSNYSKLYLEKFKKLYQGTGIIFAEPIPKMEIIRKLDFQYKSIWDSNSNLLSGVKQSLNSILEPLIIKQRNLKLLIDKNFKNLWINQ